MALRSCSQDCFCWLSTQPSLGRNSDIHQYSSSVGAGPTASHGARVRGSFEQVIAREIQALDLYGFSPLAEQVTGYRFVRLCTPGCQLNSPANMGVFATALVRELVVATQVCQPLDSKARVTDTHFGGL